MLPTTFCIVQAERELQQKYIFMHFYLESEKNLKKNPCANHPRDPENVEQKDDGSMNRHNLCTHLENGTYIVV